MPSLVQSLHGRDLGFLRIVTELWGIELEITEARLASQKIASQMLNPPAVAQIVTNLPEEARSALNEIKKHLGRLPWPVYIRRFGPIREMGPARRDRDKPYLNPVSAGEILWYRALVARAFFNTPDGPSEFAYIPDDLMDLLSAPPAQPDLPTGRTAFHMEYQYPLLAGDAILDHSCTLLAALRSNLDLDQTFTFVSKADPKAAVHTPSTCASLAPLSPATLQALLTSAGLLDDSGVPRPEPTRLFLESRRGEALAQLSTAWINSPDFNELRFIPHLVFEGIWGNDPLKARKTVLGFISHLPEGTWWSLPSFVSTIRQVQPDFQRPAGDYDSWLISHAQTGEFLRGFERWDEVDGALIRYLIAGPLFWLGMLDLASQVPGGPVTAFRLTRWAAALLEGKTPQGLPPEEEKIMVKADGKLHVPHLSPRSARYLLARFTRWEGEEEGIYLYRITPASLMRARKQGLAIPHLLALLRRYASALPPNLEHALERWDTRGTDVRLERLLVLRLSSPDLLQALRKSRAARFLADPLGPTSIIVKPGAWKKVITVLVEMGYLCESDIEE